MSEKRFILCQDDLGNYEIRYDDKVFHFLCEVAPILNEQQDQISYWKHKVSSLLWILGQFDKAKVKELLKELEDE